MRVADLSELLRERGMRVTSQRVLIDRALRDHGGHLTAEQVHDLVEPGLPGVTQQTVYSTLALLAELGVARRVSAPGASTRFEARVDDHHHMVCERCGAIEDLDVKVPVSRAVGASRERGFVPASASVTVLGLCAACSAQ
jgi:Fur family transcriptional regulator, stress-responsive regulator